jgi:DNA polymerase-3 subunit delta
VRERTEALIRAAVDDPRDPFQLARLDGDDLSGAPARLVEEVATIPLFGGRRAVWVKAGSRNFVPAVEALLAAACAECRVVIEAGDLKRNAPLRALCERAANAVVLPCYTDGEQALARLIDAEMAAAGLSISPDARAALVPLLGGDRLASRNELHKLAMFARGKAQVGIADVRAVVSDASKLELDELIDATFAGRTDRLEIELRKTQTAGTGPGTIMAAALRHVAQLHKARLAVENGVPIGDAVGGMQPFLHFSRRAAVETALSSWTSSRLERAMAHLADASLQARLQYALADLIARRALLSLAVAARTRAQ